MNGWEWLLGSGALLAGSAGAYWAGLRQRQMHRWMGSYYGAARPRPVSLQSGQPLHVFIAVCDHYEPEWGRPSLDTSVARVDRWVQEYPRLFERFHDVRGQVPQHTFFFPQDEYRPEYLDRLVELCHAGFGDVDVHLHHDHDTAESLHEKLTIFRDTLYHRHGTLRRDPVTNEIVYGFIHGNWALCNSRPDGRWCGVDQELTVLRDTGCYADFTMPSAPSPTQIGLINSIYYAKDIPGERASHRQGVLSKVHQSAPAEHLLMVQGPLLPDWSRRKYGVFPRIENGDLHGGRGPNWERLKLWLRAGVHVAERPDWLFVKLHTHGCKTGNIDTLLGEETQAFHASLAQYHAAHPEFRYHYVTAWEMAQLVHQAEAGQTTPDWSRLSQTCMTHA